MKRSVLFVLLFSIFAATIIAQHAPPPRPGGPVFKERLRQRIGMIRIWKLIETLELTEKQSMGFFPILNAHDIAEERFRSNEKRLMDELSGLLDSDYPDEIEMSAILDSIDIIQIDKFERDRAFFESVSGVLSVEQKARLLIFEQRFAEEMRHLIEKGVSPGKETRFANPFKKRMPK